MRRIPEPELMDDPEQARAYADADFAEPHARFVTLLRERLPEPPAALAGRRFGLVLSNSLLHHLAAPATLWDAVRRFTAPGAFVFVMDLLRPPSRAAAEALVARYAAGEPDVLRRDFLHSLCAAYRPDELREQLRPAGLEALSCEVVSDRHWIAFGLLS